ncbi:hypothetical protein LWI28_026647 [Acer negundo]|uniref:Glycosyl transferase, family 14 n=1 Tax=Acer negundo TaxID=4023 RepID=A0AAD5NKS7_ACENE|nr:hypothetical protein LWI28_026647 [Acer negundo]
MGNEAHLIQSISKSLNKHLQLNHVYRIIFFVIGLSLGIIISLYLKNFSLTIQASLFPLPSTPTPPPPNGNYTSVSLKEEKFVMMHNMSDEELLKASTAVPKIEDYKQLVPKVALMFLTKGPLPLAPLWEKFLQGHEGLYSIYVHSHPDFVETPPPNSIFIGRTIPSQPVYWGTATMIDAERRLIANALLDISNQRFVLLSESCIPLFDFKTIYNYLINSNSSFLGSFDDPRKPGRGRYNPKMWPVINITNWRKGSQWFELHRDLAVHIVSDTKYYTIFNEYCRPPCYMDEHYIPTLVNMLYPELNSNRSITWVDWSRGGPHPGKFGWSDITDEFLNQIRYGSECMYNGNVTSLCFLFARKFLPITLEPLLRVGPLLLGYDP